MLKVVAKRRDQDRVPDLWLCFAPLKKDSVDFLIEKGTELGVSVFQPVMTRRTNSARLNLDRLATNAIEAAEQTERLTLPEIRPSIGFQDLLRSWPKERRMILCAEAGPARGEVKLGARTSRLSLSHPVMVGLGPTIHEFRWAKSRYGRQTRGWSGQARP